MVFENTFDELKFRIMRKLVPNLDNNKLKETVMPYFDVETGKSYLVDLRQDNEFGWQIERIICVSSHESH